MNEKLLSEAKNTENAVVILEGDWGGQIYLTCPMNLVNCDEETLGILLGLIRLLHIYIPLCVQYSYVDDNLPLHLKRRRIQKYAFV